MPKIWQKKMKKIHDTAPSTFFYNEKMRMLCKDYCGSGLTCLGYNTCLQIRKGFLMLLNNINIYIYEIINQWKMSEWKKKYYTKTEKIANSIINSQSAVVHYLKILKLIRNLERPRHLNCNYVSIYCNYVIRQHDFIEDIPS